MRDAVFTVSPNRQYRGIFDPTTPAHTGPVKIMIIILLISLCENDVRNIHVFVNYYIRSQLELLTQLLLELFYHYFYSDIFYAYRNVSLSVTVACQVAYAEW